MEIIDPDDMQLQTIVLIQFLAVKVLNAFISLILQKRYHKLSLIDRNDYRCYRENCYRNNFIAQN